MLSDFMKEIPSGHSTRGGRCLPGPTLHKYTHGCRNMKPHSGATHTQTETDSISSLAQNNRVTRNRKYLNLPLKVSIEVLLFQNTDFRQGDFREESSGGIILIRLKWLWISKEFYTCPIGQNSAWVSFLIGWKLLKEYCKRKKRKGGEKTWFLLIRLVESSQLGHTGPMFQMIISFKKRKKKLCFLLVLSQRHWAVFDL